MTDVDALACSIEPLIAKHSEIAFIFRELDQLQRPKNMLQQPFLLARHQNFNIYNTESLFQSSQIILFLSPQFQQATNQLQIIKSHHQCQSTITH